MSKTFKTAKKPSRLSPDQITAFESGGPGHDHKPTNGDPHNPSKEPSREPAIPQTHIEPTKRLSLDLPETVHRRFKTACSATDTKMVAEVMEFIEKRTVELEDMAGIT